MKKVLLRRLAVAVLVACSMLSAANAAKRSPAMCTKTIELKQTDWTYMQQVIGIDDQGRPCSIVLADETTKSSVPSLAPEGIDSVVERSSNSLCITGTPAAVNKLIGIIGGLDVTPKIIQIKLASYLVDSKLADEISPTASTHVVPTPAQVTAFLVRLRDAGNSPVVSPILHTLNRTRGEIGVTTSITMPGPAAESEYLIEFRASTISQVVSDTTVSSRLIVSFSGDVIGSNQPRGSHAFHNSRFVSQDYQLGETYCAARQDILGKTLLTFVTFTIVDQQLPAPIRNR